MNKTKIKHWKIKMKITIDREMNKEKTTPATKLMKPKKMNS
jgi:hypothetical protein